MATLSRYLIGIASMLLGFHIASIFLDPIFDIAHNLLNESIPAPPNLSYYIYRSVLVYQTPYGLFILLFGLLLGYSRFRAGKERLGIAMFFSIPVSLAIVSFVYISVTDFTEQGILGVLQGVVRAVDFLSPFVLAWFLALPVAKVYERFTQEDVL